MGTGTYFLKDLYKKNMVLWAIVDIFNFLILCRCPVTVLNFFLCEKYNFWGLNLLVRYVIDN